MRTPVLLLTVALAAAACASSEEPTGEDGSGSLLECAEVADEVTVTGDAGEKPAIEVPQGPPPCELVSTDLTEGEGAEAIAGGSLTMHYVGVSWSTGAEFDASWNGGQPFPFTLGAGQVIPGWDQGIQGMRVGGRRLLVIPSDLGYGDAGQGAIAPGETLVFVVDLLGVAEPPSCRRRGVALRRGSSDAIVVSVTRRAGRKPRVTYGTGDPPCELQVVDVVEGDGAEAKAGSQLKMQYVGVAWSTGKQFDASWDRGEPFSFVLGQGAVIQGWDQGILGMRVGGRRLLVIPSELGYGAQGAGGDIPPFETLVFVVDLLAAKAG